MSSGLPEFETPSGGLRATSDVIFETATEVSLMFAEGTPIGAYALQTTVADRLNEYGIGRQEIETEFTEAFRQIEYIDTMVEGIVHG